MATAGLVNCIQLFRIVDIADGLSQLARRVPRQPGKRRVFPKRREYIEFVHSRKGLVNRAKASRPGAIPLHGSEDEALRATEESELSSFAAGLVRIAQ